MNGLGQTPYFTWAELNYSLGRPKLFSVRLLGQRAELNSAELKKETKKKTCKAGLFAEAYVNMINFFMQLVRRLTQSRSLGVLRACTSREERLSRSTYNKLNLNGSKLRSSAYLKYGVWPGPKSSTIM